jgi:DNA-binding transcriptional MerR regulator
MTEPRYRLPSEVAKHLQISPSTLRRWSNEFSEFLSDAAGKPHPAEGGQTAHRRYTDQDVESLLTIKGLLEEGLTYIQAGRRLEALQLRQQADDWSDDAQSSEVRALGPSLRDASSAAPAFTVLADTLHTVADSQQILMGSQQANRDLLTVVLQDNFGLKEENTKLRDRMLELERDLAEIRRKDAERHEAFEARIHKLEEQPRHQPKPHATTPSSSKRSGCLGQLLGS